MFIPSISAVMECFRSRNRVITLSRVQSKSGPVRSISLRQNPLNLDLALETRRRVDCGESFLKRVGDGLIVDCCFDESEPHAPFHRISVKRLDFYF